MKRFMMLLTLGAALIPGPWAQEKTASGGLAYLLDGAVRIYAVDESRCSAGPGKPEGGQWYLIEGEKKLNDLREALADVSTDELNGCGCGGPDVHFYAENEAGKTRYFGLDCGVALDGVQLPSSLQNILGPSKKEFIGVLGGQTYLVDIPLNVDEQDARKKFAEAGLNLLVSGYWNVFSQAGPREDALEMAAPVTIELRVGPFKDSRPAPKFPGANSESAMMAYAGAHQQWEREVVAKARPILQVWLDQLGLRQLQMAPDVVRTSMAGYDETLCDAEVFLKDPEAVRKALAKPDAKNDLVSVSKVEYRTPAEIKARSKYQAALLLPGFATPSELKRIKNVLPGIGRVVPLCECHETEGAK